MKYFKVHIILLLLIGLLVPVHAQQCIPETKLGNATFIASSDDAVAFVWLINDEIIDTTYYPDTTYTTNFAIEGQYEVSVIPVSDSGVWGNDTTISINVFKNYDDMSVIASWTNSNVNVCDKGEAVHNIVNISLTIKSDLIQEGEKYAVVYQIDNGPELTRTFYTKTPSFDIDILDLEDNDYHEFSIIHIYHGLGLQCLINYRPDPNLMNLNIRTVPFVDIGQDIEVCENDSFRFELENINPENNYLWNNITYGSVYADIARTTKTILLQVTNKYNCSSYDSAEVVVHPLPYTSIRDFYTSEIITDTLLCGDQKLTLDAGTEGLFFDWSTGEITNTIVVPALNPWGKDSIKNYYVTIESAYGCLYSNSINVVRCMPPTKENTPEVFTPNGDGKNDCWEIQGIENFYQATIDVYDRWGRIVFHSIGYNNKWCGSFNGKEQPMDNYFYVIRVSPDAEPFNGTVMIVR